VKTMMLDSLLQMEAVITDAHYCGRRGFFVSLLAADLRRDVYRSMLAATRRPNTALVRYLTRIIHVVEGCDWRWCLKSACTVLKVFPNVGGVLLQ
jgi:hypothetical protein